MKRWLRHLAWLIIIALFVYLIFALDLLAPGNWALLLLLTVTLVIALFVSVYESRTLTTKEIALVAIMGAVSAAARLPFAAMPSIQPCTYIILCVGYVYGPTAGFMTATITVLVSNTFLGHGPWTPFQIFAWGIIGASAHLLKALNIREYGLVIWGGVCAFVFGLTMNLWTWTAFVRPLTPTSFMFTYVQSIWFDVLHAAANIVFLIAFGWRTVVVLERYRDRFHIDFEAKNKSIKDNGLEELA